MKFEFYHFGQVKETALYASKYIHLNPVKAKLVRHPVEWQYSSYQDYRIPTSKPFVKKDLILSYFKTPQAYESFVLNEEDGTVDSFED
jgi:hypothetical protein